MSEEATQHLVLYDGVCGFCHGAVRFLLARDDRDVFRFAPLQSEVARRALEPHGKDPEDLDTMYLITDWGRGSERCFERSRAVLAAALELGGPWRALIIFWPLPSVLLDPLYRLVAWLRYRLTPRHETCTLPSPSQRHRFLGFGESSL